MKKGIILVISLLLMNYCYANSGKLLTEENTFTRDSLNIISTPDLFSLSNKWAEEFNRVNPEIKIKIIRVSDKRTIDKFIDKGIIGLVSKEYYSGFDSQSLWKAVVGRDVIVPIINSKNPFSGEICQHGVPEKMLAQLLRNADSRKWGTLMKNNQNAPVSYYWINDESIKAGLSGYLKIDQDLKYGMKVENSKDLISAIQKDSYGLGFCKMTDIFDFNNKNIIENIKILPLDKNVNGTIDFNEKIYGDYDAFARVVWIGKYPKALIRNVYSISSHQLKNENEVAFLKWILTYGQQYLYESGYSDLLLSERQTTVDQLNTAKIYTTSTNGNSGFPKPGLLILASLIMISIILNVTIPLYRHGKIIEPVVESVSQTFPNENSLSFPKGIYFDKTHTWAFMEQNGIVKVGIDDFLQHITGPITRVKVKKEGESVKKGEQILSVIQNGKQLNLYAPVSGIIREHNKTLDSDSSVLNNSPYNDGWVYMIEPTNWNRENQLLFMAEKHILNIKSELSRLKDFLAGILKADSEKYAQVIMQDGGELKDGALSNLGPEVWEDFQTNFIDPARQVWFYEIF